MSSAFCRAAGLAEQRAVFQGTESAFRSVLLLRERPDLASFESGDNSPIDFLRRKEWEHV